MRRGRRLPGIGAIIDDTPRQCDFVTFDEWSAFRCRMRLRHGGYCNFNGARNGDGICGARVINFASRKLRRCVMTEEHEEGHIFLWVTERDAEPKELDMPDTPHVRAMIVRETRSEP